MFKLRLLGRGGRVPAERPARGSQSGPARDATATAASAEGIRLALRDKALVAAALAEPPTWTNALPAAHPRERSINARSLATLPPVTPFAMNTGQPAAEGAAPGATTGGQSWHSSADPH